jgi:ABC-type transport system substrate-binding protein
MRKSTNKAALGEEHEAESKGQGTLTYLPPLESGLACPENLWAGKKDDTLNIASQVEITNVDKYYNATRIGTWVQHLGWDFLLHIDRNTNKVVPALAISWKYVGDKNIELELRKGVKFHSGKEMTADDAVYTINYIYTKDLEFKPTLHELPQFYNTRWK